MRTKRAAVRVRSCVPTQTTNVSGMWGSGTGKRERETWVEELRNLWSDEGVGGERPGDCVHSPVDLKFEGELVTCVGFRVSARVRMEIRHNSAR